MKFRCVLFGLDGTLADTLENISRSLNGALAFYGYPVRPEASFAPLAGLGMLRAASASLPPDARNSGNAEKVAQKARELYAEKTAAHSKPYPEIMELLHRLETMKIKTAVLASTPEPAARLVIDALFPPSYFDLVQGEVPGVPEKPDPQAAWEIMMNLGVTPRETIFCGNSEIDMETALSAECSPLGACWGFSGREALIQAGAPRVIDRPLDLVALIRGTKY